MLKRYFLFVGDAGKLKSWCSQKAFLTMLRDHPPVLTHGNFLRQNVMVKRVDVDSEGGDTQGAVQNWEAVIVYW